MGPMIITIPVSQNNEMNNVEKRTIEPKIASKKLSGMCQLYTSWIAEYEWTAYGKPMFANVVGARVKSTVFVKFATTRSLSARQYGNGKKRDLLKIMRNVHILSRTSS